MLTVLFIILYVLCICITLLSTTIHDPLPVIFEFSQMLFAIKALSILTTSYLLGCAVQAVTGKYSGEIWGYRISMSKRILFLRVLGIIGGLVSLILIIPNIELIVLGFVQDVVNFFVGLVKIVFTLNLKDYLLWLLGFMLKLFTVYLGFHLGFSLFVKVGLKSYASHNDLKKLENLPLLADVDRCIDSTKLIYVDGNQIVLTSFDDEKTHFLYSDYGLKSLERSVTAVETKQVASFEIGLLGLYFANKYKDHFKFSVNKALVKGRSAEPGNKIRILTNKGVFYATTRGASAIRDKTPFNGYTFIRK